MKALRAKLPIVWAGTMKMRSCLQAFDPRKNLGWLTNRFIFHSVSS